MRAQWVTGPMVVPVHTYSTVQDVYTSTCMYVHAYSFKTAHIKLYVHFTRVKREVYTTHRLSYTRAHAHKLTHTHAHKHIDHDPAYAHEQAHAQAHAQAHTYTYAHAPTPARASHR